MSLRPDDRQGRGRSSSTSGRDRERSRSNVRAPEVPEPPGSFDRAASYEYEHSRSGYDDRITSPSYEVRSPTSYESEYFSREKSSRPRYEHSASASMPYPKDDFTMGDYTDLPPHERPGYTTRPSYPSGQPVRRESKSTYEVEYDGRNREELSRHSSYSKTSDSVYKYTPRPEGESRSSSYTYQYAPAPEKITYTTRPQGRAPSPERRVSYTSRHEIEPQSARHSSVSQAQYRDQPSRTYSHDAYERDTRVVEMRPIDEKHDRTTSFERDTRVVEMRPSDEKHDRTTSFSRTHSLSVHAEQPGLQPHRSSGLGHRLSVSGQRPDLSSHGSAGGGLPPGSPLLEAYHGTYQSISPMPFAMRHHDDEDELDELEPLDSMETLSITTSRTSERTSHKGHETGHAKKDKDGKDHRDKDGKRRVMLYDAEADAKKLASALNHHKPDGEAICDILPRLSHDQIMELRKEYKKQVKIQGKGVNLSKHIKTKLTGNFGKAVYVTALGKYESEGYWANFWYQSHGSRRELLIESLMGRTNSEIRMIEDDFRDKRYSDSLKKCMEKELKMDKFRTAVLMALEGRRQEEQDVYPREYVIKDVDTLYRTVTEEKGSESAMLEIIVRRSDAHLREVLRTYEHMYKENFARAALRRSNNLVGEVIAHILNGVINKPARDALLLQHAIKDIAEKNRDDELRYELLISRLVRMHWDRLHLARVQREYYDKYRVTLIDAIEEATKGDFSEYMCELCETK